MLKEKYSKIFVSLPVLDERDYLPFCLKALEKQTFRNFEVFICVNQPDEWWNIEEKKQICINNQKTLEFLKSYKKISVKIIDKSSKYNGWNNKNLGIGWARKTIMDKISSSADNDYLIVSIDADTVFNENYFTSLINIFNKKPEAVAMSVPYYHNLTNDEVSNKAILRYEIYMRYYLLNLFRINSPYSFTALGSAIVIPVWAYKKTGGITPKKSGEDFYFLQKLAKYGKILNYCSEKVFPAARFSDRVFFGTGPAMIKGAKGDWESYPIYDYSLFDEIKKSYELISLLFQKNIETKFLVFIENQFKSDNLWKLLRNNSTSFEKFRKAFHGKADGLRILQFLKSEQKLINKTDENCLMEFLNKFYKNDFIKTGIDLQTFSFSDLSINTLNKIRNFLFEAEENYRKSNTF
ncbi:MAG: glycosyltransferase [Bacteroidales bacterium]|jgi:glycosyltransferase involved in cell wall biosynthesis